MQKLESPTTGCGILAWIALMAVCLYCLPACSAIKSLGRCPCPLPQQTIMERPDTTGFTQIEMPTVGLPGLLQKVKGWIVGTPEPLDTIFPEAGP